MVYRLSPQRKNTIAYVANIQALALMAYTPDNPAPRPKSMPADPLRVALASPTAYRLTTENISGYLDALEAQGALCLCVAASGDQTVNLFAAGAERVLCFDRDPLALKMTRLKMAAVAGLDYEQFKGFYGIENFGSFDLNLFETRILPHMRMRGDWFTQRLADPYSLFLGYTSLAHWNPYLADEGAYLVAQNSVRAVFESRGKNYRSDDMECDVRDLACMGDEQFDVIVLSNIIDHWLRHMITMESDVGGLLRSKERLVKPIWKPGWLLGKSAQLITWPVARLLRPGGRMLAGYFYREKNEFGNLRRAFRAPKGFSTEILSIPFLYPDEISPDQAVIIRRNPD